MKTHRNTSHRAGSDTAQAAPAPAPTPRARKNPAPAGPPPGRGEVVAKRLGYSLDSGAQTPVTEAQAAGPVVSKREGARLLGCDWRRLDAAIYACDVLPAEGEGRTARFRLSDLRDALDAHATPHPDTAQATAALADLAANLAGRLAAANLPPPPAN
jgi:hypothetical protein